MNSTITRRQAMRILLAGSAGLASTAVALSGPLAVTIFARQSISPVLLLGVQAGPVPTTTEIPEIATSEVDSARNPSSGSVAVPVRVHSFDMATGQVRAAPTPEVLPDGTPILQSNEALTGITTLTNGTIVLSIHPVSGAKKETIPTRLTLLGTPPIVLIVSGLKKDEQLGDVVGARDGRLLGLVMKKNGTPPAVVVDIDLGTGVMSVINKIHLPRDRRFRTLTECPDGTLYTMAVENGGDTILMRLDLEQNKPIDVVPLNLDGSAWNNGLESLMCAGGDQPQLLALGAPRYVTPYALYTIDLGSGAMTKLQDFDTAKASLSRA